MTDVEDLPFSYPSEANLGAAPARKCGRHDWWLDEFNVNARAICRRCGKVRDEAVVARNRKNRQNGASLERKVAKAHGGRRTGPLGGRDDVITPLFAIQTKRTARFSATEARAYLADLARIYPDKGALIVHRLPGERDGIVVLRESEWLSLHGQNKEDPR